LIGGKHRWVATLIAGLKVRLSQKLGRSDLFSLWKDEQLSPNKPLSPEILDALTQSAALVIILSPGYMASPWCQREMQTFWQALAQRARSDSRIFVIERDKLEIDEKPKALEDLLGYQLWFQDRDGKSPLNAAGRSSADAGDADRHQSREPDPAMAAHEGVGRTGSAIRRNLSPPGAQTALLHSEKRAGLLQGLDLIPVIEWKKRENPTPPGHPVMDRNLFWSGAFWLKVNTIMVKSIGKLLGVAVLYIIAALMTWLWHEANIERDKASSARLLAEGQLVRSRKASQFPLSALWGIEAVKRYPHSDFILNQFLHNSLGMQQKPLYALQHDDIANAVSFSPDGKQLATASRDITARLWLWQPDDLVNQLCGRLIYNLSWSQWREHLVGEPYRKTCDLLPINPDFREQGIKLVNAGNNAEAVRMIKELNEAVFAIESGTRNTEMDCDKTFSGGRTVAART
jgi:hypothetical protein